MDIMKVGPKQYTTVIGSRIVRSASRADTYCIKIKQGDTFESIFKMFEEFAKKNDLVWVFKYDHQGISDTEKARRYKKQLNDFLKVTGLSRSDHLTPGTTVELRLSTYDDQLFEKDSTNPLFPPLKELITDKGLLRETSSRSLEEMQRQDDRYKIAVIDYSSGPKGRSWDWKLATPIQDRTINGLPMVYFSTRPYFDKEHPEWGGDLHGVSGGITKQFPIEERPDITNATHYVFYVAISGKNDYYLSVEFFDYDADMDPDHDGFSNNPNHLAQNWGKETEEEYLQRYDTDFMQKGFEEKLLQGSKGKVDEYEFAKHRYDGYRYREYGVDGPKAQKILIKADPNGGTVLYRIELPVDPRFMKKYYINTGVGDGEINIGPKDLQRVQYVFYVTPKNSVPADKAKRITNYQRLLSLSQYYNDTTAAPDDPNEDSYLGNCELQGAVSEKAFFINDPDNEHADKVIITPIKTPN